MGSGKSYWAQRLADESNIDWMDLDAEIEKETSLTIKEIFETEGEAYFRNKERDALHNLASYQNIIVATGGGTPCFHNNMQWMNENGNTVWIDEPVEVLAKRLEPEKAHRPLIKNLNDNELKDFLSNKLKEREQFYSLAKYRLSGDALNLNKLLELLNA